MRFAAAFAAVIAWFVAAPHLPGVSLWTATLLVSFAVMPATLLLVPLALPLRELGWKPVTAGAVAMGVAAFGFAEAGWGLPENFAKFFGAVLTGWAGLYAFEELSWVVLVACVIPFVDAYSVWRGPTHTLTQKTTIHVYYNVAIAFLVPGGRAAYLGPPDVLFYALFIAAAVRWGLRVWWTWTATTFMYAITIVIATAAHIGGLPALPFLSFGFLVANADLLWSSLRRRS